MDPVFHQMMQNRFDRDSQSSLRNPDGFFPERDGVRPDPLGSWFVAALDTISDRVSSWRSRLDSGRRIERRERKGGAFSAVEVE